MDFLTVEERKKVPGYSKGHWYPDDLPNKDADVKILWLLNLFPCVSSRISFGSRGWDCTWFEKATRPLATGERQVALFILAVWCGKNWQGNGCAFDVTNAAAHMDKESLHIVCQWMLDPLWP